MGGWQTSLLPYSQMWQSLSLCHQTSGMWKCQERRRLLFSFVWTFCSDRQILTEHQLCGRPLPGTSVLDLGVGGNFTSGRETLGQEVRQGGGAMGKVRGSGGPLPPSRKEANFSTTWLYLRTVAVSDSPSPTSKKARPGETSG